MKTYSVRFVLLFLAFLTTSVAKGANFSGLPGFGSKEDAITASVANSIDLYVKVYQITAAGVIRKASFVKMEDSSSKMKIDEAFRKKLCSLAESVLTNSVEKDQSFGFVAFTTKFNPRLGDIPYLYLEDQFWLTKSEDGSYHLPDFSGLQLDLPSVMIFEIPGLEWGRIEVSDNPQIYPYDDPRMFWETDTRFDSEEPLTGFSLDEGYVQIKTDWITSGTNGPTLIKVSFSALENAEHVFRVVGPSGMQVPETPISITNPRMSKDFTCFDVEGGDPGRVVMVQYASDLFGPWIDTGEMLPVPRYGEPLHFKQPQSGNFGLHRIRTVNAKPF